MGSASLTGGCLEGVQGPPCRGSGCPRKTLFLSFCLPPTAAREKKRGFWGHPRPRQRAGRPLHSRLGDIHPVREYYPSPTSGRKRGFLLVKNWRMLLYEAYNPKRGRNRSPGEEGDAAGRGGLAAAAGGP